MKMRRGQDVEDKEGVVWVWDAQTGHVPASPVYAARLRIERLCRRLRRPTYIARRRDGTLKVEWVPPYGGLLY
jgi:hypothetical protein